MTRLMPLTPVIKPIYVGFGRHPLTNEIYSLVCRLGRPQAVLSTTCVQEPAIRGGGQDLKVYMTRLF